MIDRIYRDDGGAITYRSPGDNHGECHMTPIFGYQYLSFGFRYQTGHPVRQARRVHHIQL